MLCVIAKLDETATGKLIQLQKTALPAGAEAKPLYGHITLAAYIGDDEPRFIRSCRSLLADVPPFAVEYDAIEVLEETSVIAAMPVKSGLLVSLHRRIAAAFADDLDRWTKDDSWLPHTTLLFDPQADLQGICANMISCFSPFAACVNRIEFSRVRENGYEIVDRMDLFSR